MLESLTQFFQVFINLFSMSGEVFKGMVIGIVPTLVVLLTLINALIKIIGQKRINGFAKFASKNFIMRYTVLPVVASLLIPAPLPLTMGKFLQEKHKPAFYDATVTLAHPFDGLFPWVHPAEIMVVLGLAQGLQKLGLSPTPFFLRAIIVAIIVAAIRGVVTERVTVFMMKRNKAKALNSYASIEEGSR